MTHFSQKGEETQVSKGRWKDKQNGIYNTMEYYSALKRNEILAHTTTWMKPEGIALSKMSQTQKDKPVWYLLPEAPWSNPLCYSILQPPRATVHMTWHFRFAQQEVGEHVGKCFNYLARI